MEFSSTVEFANAARLLSRAAANGRLITPSFRCPPRLVGVDRTIRRRSVVGDAVVSIRVKGRPREAVLADMIEGVVVANELTSPDADRVRGELWTVATKAMTVERAERGAA